MVSNQIRRKMKTVTRKAIKNRILDEYGYEPTEKELTAQEEEQQDILDELKDELEP